MTGRVIVVQPECKSRAGHPYAAIKSLEHAIAPQEPLICVHRHASRAMDLPQDRTIRHFSGRLSAPKDSTTGASTGFRELNDLFLKASVTADDHLVFPSASAETALALIRLLQHRRTRSWPQCYLRFIGDERRTDLEPEAHQRLNDVRSNTDRLNLRYEFEGNIRHVLKYYKHNPFEPTRLPTSWPDQFTAQCEKVLDEPFTIGVFGPPRRDKGKHRLASILAMFFAQMRQAELHSSKVIVQKDSRLDRTLKLRADLLLRLGKQAARISFSPAEVTNTDFTSRLRQSDVVLVPYIQKSYARRGSGIVIDAVASGVPVVFTHGTAMGELVDCGNGLAASDDGEFAQCLFEVANNRVKFRDAARAAAVRARDWWSDSMLSALRRVQHPTTIS